MPATMQQRFASINDLPIQAAERKFFWPLGRRPDDHPSLSELGPLIPQTRAIDTGWVGQAPLLFNAASAALTSS